jgi:hypothetical protein
MPPNPLAPPRGNRTQTVATKLTVAEKAELEKVAAASGMTVSDALRQGALYFMALQTFVPPNERAALDANAA